MPCPRHPDLPLYAPTECPDCQNVNLICYTLSKSRGDDTLYVMLADRRHDNSAKIQLLEEYARQRYGGNIRPYHDGEDDR